MHQSARLLTSIEPGGINVVKSSIGVAGCEAPRGERADTMAAVVIRFCTAAGSFADVICIALRWVFLCVPLAALLSVYGDVPIRLHHPPFERYSTAHFHFVFLLFSHLI